MSTRIIQVPMAPGLVAQLDRLSKQRGVSRAAVIRDASAEYLRRAAEERAIREYVLAYERIPETSEIAEAQESMLAEVLPKEEW